LVLFFEKDHLFQLGFTIPSLIPLLKLAIFASSLAFIFYTYAIKHIGISKATAFTNAIPILTSVFAYFLLREGFNYLKIFGIGLVIAGLFISQIRLDAGKNGNT
jgi:drug/metabolite transporter (DMT)-like permease